MPKEYQADYAYGPSASNEAIFEDLVRQQKVRGDSGLSLSLVCGSDLSSASPALAQVIETVLGGGVGLLLAYGQTGSGKVRSGGDVTMRSRSDLFFLSRLTPFRPSNTWLQPLSLSYPRVSPRRISPHRTSHRQRSLRSHSHASRSSAPSLATCSPRNPSVQLSRSPKTRLIFQPASRQSFQNADLFHVYSISTATSSPQRRTTSSTLPLRSPP